MPTPNPDPNEELSLCRTYYSPSYISADNYNNPEDIPNDEFSHTFSLTLEDQPEADGNIRETIIGSSYNTTDTEDSGTSFIDNGDHTYTYSGLYTIDSFPNIKMTFRTDFVNNTEKTIVGWPPSDPRAKDMNNISLDSRDSRTYSISITWIIQTETYQIEPPPSTAEPEWVITDTSNYSKTWYKDAGNKVGHYFSTILGEYFNGT
jgi:hypothetical protein